VFCAFVNFRLPFRFPFGTMRIVPLLLCAGLLGSLLGAPLPAEAQRAAERPERLFARGLSFYNDQLYNQAAERLATYRRSFPNAPNAAEALYFEAKSMLALGRQNEAVALFRQLRAEFPDHPRSEEAQFSLAQYFIDRGDYDRARSMLEEMVELYPDNPRAARALYQLGTAERSRSNYGTALDYFRRVVREYGSSTLAPAAAYAIAATQVRMDRYEAAAQSFERLGEQYPRSPYAQNLGLALAEVYYELGQYERVVEEVKRRLPNLQGATKDRATFLLAEAYNQLRNSQQAIVYYQRFTEDNQDSPYYRNALYGLAWNYHFEETYQWAADRFARVHEGYDDALAEKAAYYEGVNRALAGRPDEALALYQRVIDTWPDGTFAPQAQYEIGMIHYQNRRWADAGQAFQTVIDTYPESSRYGDALYMRGNTFIAQNDLDEAFSYFNRAIDLDAAPDSLREEVIFQKAWLLYLDGRHDEAAPAFMQIYESDRYARRSEDALFWGAESIYQTGNLGRAQSLFQQYLEAHPDGTHTGGALYALGWTYFKQQRYQSAANTFQRFLQQYASEDEAVPYRTDALLRLGDSYYATKQYSAAIRTYRRAEGESQGYALYQTGQALNLAGRPEEAVRTLQRLVENFPQSRWREEALYRIGYINLQNQNYEASIAAYRTLIDEYPDVPLAAEAQYGIGEAHYNAGNLSQAVDAYRRVLNQYPDSDFTADAASSMQYALIAQGAEDRATAIIDSFATANPNSSLVAELRFRQAEATYRSGNTENALQMFRRFVRNSSNETLLPRAYYYLGVINAERDQQTEAINYLRQVVEGYPSSDRRPEAALRLGDLYLEQEQYERALSTYRLVAEGDQAGADAVAQARDGMSKALLALDRAEEAKSMLQQIVETSPNPAATTSARLGLARILEDEGQVERAQELYRTVVDQGQGEIGAEALFRLGALLLDQAQPQEAIRELSRMPALFPGYPEWTARSYLEQARAYRRQGQTGEASRLYDRVQEEYAGTEFAQTAAQEQSAM
jgi:TolA-binding protein